MGNFQDFVDRYADYLLNSSVDKKFRAFCRGFQMVTDESPLPLLFRPEEVELLVCGSRVSISNLFFHGICVNFCALGGHAKPFYRHCLQDFDFNELEKATDYENGYTEKSQTIIDFWSIVHSLPLESKKKLLEFTTGT